jgi:hypothetical protein
MALLSASHESDVHVVYCNTKWSVNYQTVTRVIIQHLTTPTTNHAMTIMDAVVLVWCQ